MTPARNLLVFVVACLAGTAAAQPIKIQDYRKLVTISSLAFSPSGSELAFVKSTQDFDADRNVKTITVAQVSTGRLMSLASGDDPLWSPDGKLIAFTTSGTNKQDQVFVIPVSGGKARELTHAKNGVQQFSWSPSGDRIAYVTPDDDPNAAAIARHDDLFEIRDDGYLTSSVRVPSHLWLVPTQGGPAKRLTHGTWSVLETAAPFTGGPSDPSWSRDGQFLAFARQENADNSDSDQTQIATVNVGNGEVALLSDAHSYEYQPSFSPRGGEVAYLRPHGPTPLSGMDVFGTSALDANTDLTADLDRDVTGFQWAPGSDDLVVMGGEGVKGRVWDRSASGEIHRLSTGDLSVDQFCAGKGGLIAFVGSHFNTPPEIYISGLAAGRPRQLTHLNDALLKFQYGESEEITWTAPDGEKCDGVLTKPVDCKQEKKYPLMVWCHGGPEAYVPLAYIGSESAYLRQTFAARGYFVFEPNYRGSDNLGNAHEHAIYKDPGDGPYSDVLTGIIAVEAKGGIDENRVSVGGHSYGGFMTAWLISHDHRWKSAVVADGAVDWRDTFNLTGDGNLGWARDSLGGTPWDPETAELYRSGSPITYADQITTPTFIISGTADETVPISESYALYHALHERHVPVKFVGIPGAHHSPDDPVRYERFNETMEEWILQHDKS